MERVQVVVSRSTLIFPIFSWIIQLVLWKRYSHTSIHYTDIITGQSMVSETANGEAHEVLYERWIQQHKIVRMWNLEIDKTQYIEFKRISNQLKQVPYQRIMGLIGLLIYRISFGKIKVFNDGLKSVFCSESDVEKLKALGIFFLKERDFILPTDIVEKFDRLADMNPRIQRLL